MSVPVLVFHQILREAYSFLGLGPCAHVKHTSAIETREDLTVLELAARVVAAHHRSLM